MGYEKTTWNPGVAPGISAANLNKLETQYDEAKADLETHEIAEDKHRWDTGAVLLGQGLDDDPIAIQYFGAALAGTVSITPGSVDMGAAKNCDVGVEGLLTTHKVFVQCQGNLEDALVCSAAYCPVNGTLRVRILNTRDGSSTTGSAKTWAYLAF